MLAKRSFPPGPLPAKLIERVLKQNPRDGSGLFSRSQLIAGFRSLSRQNDFGISEAEFVERVQMRPIRTSSGVSPVTVFTKPFACPGQCIFCPNDTRMPKSYLSDEPGAQRAEDNAFDPYLQTWGRLNVFRSIGHSTSKVELIVLGGTWSHYPEGYQRWFIKRCFDALNDFGRGIDRRASCDPSQRGYPAAWTSTVQHDGVGRRYNERVTSVLRTINHGSTLSEQESAEWRELQEAHCSNEAGECRCVGLTVETRPDEVTEANVVLLRRLGCTKVQLGFQSLDDEVLRRNKRGHDVQTTRCASRLLRSAGFKIHAHWMPNLLGSSPAKDHLDFDRIFADPALRPDELKIYPCSLIETAELMGYYNIGQWKPYTNAELVAVLGHALSNTPRYCRLTRVIRDIPSGDIVVGNHTSNLREIVSAKLSGEGILIKDIRARESRRVPVAPEHLCLRTTVYLAGSGEEHFLEWVTADDRLAAYLRLFLPRVNSFVSEIHRSALLRELHVYGTALDFNARKRGSPQHQGLGRTLIEAAARIAADQGFANLAVISAVGTRGYYRQLGFADGPLYQHLKIGGQGTHDSPA
jgi:elongator complex protein 3